MHRVQAEPSAPWFAWRQLATVMTALILAGACAGDGSGDDRTDVGSPEASAVPNDSELRLGLGLPVPRSEAGLYSMDLDGEGLRQVASNLGQGAAWSPDGSRIAYVDGSPPQIWLMSSNGEDRQQLTDYDDAADSPTWSWDGTKIAFVRGAWSGADMDIYVMDADGQNQKQITTDDRVEISPALSPDGSKVAFEEVVTATGAGDIYVVDVESGDEMNLTPDVATDSFPQWSPDGDVILFKRASGGLWQVPSDGGEPQRIPLPFTQPSAPRWSPDGTKIAFFVEAPPDFKRLDVFVVDADGRKIRHVRRVRGPVAAFSWVPSS